MEQEEIKFDPDNVDFCYRKSETLVHLYVIYMLFTYILNSLIKHWPNLF